MIPFSFVFQVPVSVKRKVPSELPAIQVAHPGQSYNPALDDHQASITHWEFIEVGFLLTFTPITIVWHNHLTFFFMKYPRNSLFLTSFQDEVIVIMFQGHWTTCTKAVGLQAVGLSCVHGTFMSHDGILF